MLFDMICIWGWPLHSHTHSYIHNGFFRAAQFLGIKTVWLDNKPGLGDNLPPNTLFITEGQVDSNIPLRDDCFYVLHNCGPKYNNLKTVNIQCLTLFIEGEIFMNKPWLLKKENTLYMPWATDLLPSEIDKNIQNIETIYANREKEIQFVGYFIPDPWKEAQNYTQSKGLSFAKVGGYGLRNVSVEENMERIQKGRISPALQSREQIQRGYLPCRILKNISYGALGVSNNPHIRRLFPEHLLQGIVFGNNVQEALDNGLNTEMNFSIQKELMEFIKTNHTFIQRLEELETMFQSLGFTKFVPPKIATKPNVLHITFHKGCQLDLELVAKELDWNIDSIFLLHEEGASNDWYSLNDEIVSLFWNRYGNRIQQADIVITSDTAPLARLFVNHPIKQLVVWVCNRIDYGCTVPHYREEVAQLSRQPWVSYVAYTPFEVTFAQQKGFNIVWKGTIRPLGSKKNDSIENHKNEIFIGAYHNDRIALDLRSLVQNYVEKAGKTLSVNTRYNGLEDLKGYDAVIHIPYNASNLALFEAIANEIPYLIPSSAFMQRLIDKKEPLPYKDNLFVPDPKAEVMEWYRYKDCFITFNSFEEISTLISDECLQHCRERLKKKYEFHREVVLAQWKNIVFKETIFNTMIPYLKNALAPYTCENTFRKYFGRLPQSRHVTFQEAIRYLSSLPTTPKILELGTSRSFVDGQYEGCNSDDASYWEPHVMDRWDWSAGCFTKVMSTVFPDADITTVDLSSNHLERCKKMNEQSTKIRYIHASSVDYLRDTKETYDLIYFDTGDMTPIRDTAVLQLQEAKLVNRVLKQNGVLLIDDVHSCVPFQAGESNPLGKAYLSLPWLQENRFYISMDEYQIILRKL